MAIYRGDKRIKKIYQGTNPIFLVYRGTRLLYEAKSGSGIELVSNIYLKFSASGTSTNFSLFNASWNTNTDRIEIDVLFPVAPSLTSIINSTNVGIGTTSGKYRYKYGNSSLTNTSQSPITNNIDTLALDIDGFYVNGTLIGSSVISWSGRASIQVGVRMAYTMKNYGVRYYSEGNLVHNFVPAYDWNTHHFGFYDTVEGTFVGSPYLRGDWL